MLEKNDQITLDLFVKKWWDIGLSTERADRPTAEWAIRWLYKTDGHRQPRIEWMPSLRAMLKSVVGDTLPNVVLEVDRAIQDLGLRGAVSTVTPADWRPPMSRGVAEQQQPILGLALSPDNREDFIAMNTSLRGRVSLPLEIMASRGIRAFETMYFSPGLDIIIPCQFMSGALGYYDYLTNTVESQKLGFQTYGYTNLALSASYIMPLEDVCYVCERPTSILFDEDGRLHAENSPAVVHEDSFKIWSYHGNLVDKRIIKRKFEAREILSQNNVEIRRSMIDIYGMEDFISDVDALELNTDGYGTLYQVSLPMDEPLVVVKVVNSTPESDGSYKDYFLRVPPEMETAEQAVAWTFDMGKQPYKPAQES